MGENGLQVTLKRKLRKNGCNENIHKTECIFKTQRKIDYLTFYPQSLPASHFLSTTQVTLTSIGTKSEDVSMVSKCTWVTLRVMISNSQLEE